MALTKIDDRGLKTPIDLLDNEKIRLGTGNDLEIYHDGSDSYIDDSGTGDLCLRSSTIYLQKYTGENCAKFVADGAVELYYDNSKKLETTSDGIEVTGAIFASGKLDVPDNAKLMLGTGDDLEIYHNGTNSYLANTTGVLFLQSDGGVQIKDTGGNELHLKTVDNGAVELYHDNSKKLETTSSGVEIHNDLLLDGSANLGNYIRTNYDGGGHMYFKNNSQGANYSSHFQTYLSSDEGGTTQTHIHYYHGGYAELLHQGNSVIRTLSTGVQFRNGGNVNGQLTPDGLCFGSDTTAANALDDYEEGTFTPAFTSGKTGTITYHDQVGFYTKIGNRVFAQVYMQTSGGSTDSNGFYVGGLPYNNVGTTSYEGGGFHTYMRDFFTSAAAKENFPWLPLNSSSVTFHKWSDGNQLTGNDTTTSQHYLIFHIYYMTS